jgi:hypothetical protein
MPICIPNPPPHTHTHTTINDNNNQGQHPTPDAEIAFWKHRAAALNAIHDQLQGPRVRKARRLSLSLVCVRVHVCHMDMNRWVEGGRT